MLFPASGVCLISDDYRDLRDLLRPAARKTPSLEFRIRDDV